MNTDALVILVAVVAGAVSAVTGFGIGSLLTPILALSVDTRVAVAAVSIPHVVGTAVRLAGAALYSIASNRWLNVVFGCLLLFAAVSEATGLARRMRFRGWVAWVAGALSGLLGGLVGNQGGIRSAALLGFDLPKEKFVGTATAIALFVDGARLPVYIANQRADMFMLWPWIALGTLGVVGGTILGSRILRRVPDVWFRRVLALVLALLGGTMLWRGLQVLFRFDTNRSRRSIALIDKRWRAGVYVARAFAMVEPCFATATGRRDCQRPAGGKTKSGGQDHPGSLIPIVTSRVVH